jgi:two-component system OmpR family sensor kinase
VGLPMTNIRNTIARLTSVIFVIVAASVILAAAIGMWGLRLALRPLDRIRQTATNVASQSLSDPESRLRERVPDALANPQSEIGQLGAAFNHMLDHVDESLMARTLSEEKLRQFVADASHELRTPLASIRGYSEITLRQGEDLPADVQQSLSRIESESIRMSHLVEDLLMLARLDEGRVAEMTDVDMAEVVRDVLSDAEVRAPDHLWRSSIPSRKVLVKANRNQLVQVITNLVQNATVHTPEGTTVSVSLKTRGNDAVFEVKDNGPGIPVEVQPQLFERFRRADKGRSRATGSTGLGLAIVRGIVDAHGGMVSVASKPGRTVFSVNIPKVSAPAA